MMKSKTKLIDSLKMPPTWTSEGGDQQALRSLKELTALIGIWPVEQLKGKTLQWFQTCLASSHTFLKKS